VTRFSDVIGTLAYSNVNVVDVSAGSKNPPEGCAIVTVSSHCTAHVLLKGSGFALRNFCKFWLAFREFFVCQGPML
jgi:hypothetical protein